jgi:hypothetical protein
VLKLLCFVIVREKHPEIINEKETSYCIILNESVNDHNRYSLIKDMAVSL